MTSDIPVAFPLCPARFFGKGAMKSTVRDRICNPLRNLSANPPRANVYYGIAGADARPEKRFPTTFPTFTFRACSVPQGTISPLPMGRALHLTHDVHTAQRANNTELCGRKDAALHRATVRVFFCMEADMEWQDISTAPKDGTPILAAWAQATSDFYMVQPARWQNGHFLHTWDHGVLPSMPTHWMPLPPPPIPATR